jgi:DNA-binding transcriptional LysR family regulator
VRIIPFVQDVLVPVCSRTHPLAKRGNVTLDALAGETFVDLTPERALRQLLDQACSQRNLRRNSVYQVSGVETLLQFVSAGLGVAVVPSGLARMAAHSRQLHVLSFVKQDRSLPRWRVVIATRSQQSALTGKKTTVDLFLEAFANLTSGGRNSRGR